MLRKIVSPERIQGAPAPTTCTASETGAHSGRSWCEWCGAQLDLSGREIPAVTLRTVQQLNDARKEAWHEGGAREWSLLEWAGAMCGEAGEAANVAKKISRIDLGLRGNEASEHVITERSALCEKLAGEVAGTVLYAALLASAAGIDFSEAVIHEFDGKSEAMGFPQRLRAAPSVPRDDTTPAPHDDLVDEPAKAAETMLRRHAAMYDWTKAESKAINDFILTTRHGVGEELVALTLEIVQLQVSLAAARRDTEMLDRLPYTIHGVFHRHNWDDIAPVLTRAALGSAWQELPPTLQRDYDANIQSARNESNGRVFTAEEMKAGPDDFPYTTEADMAAYRSVARSDEKGEG